MKNLEWATAPIGTASSILAMTAPTVDDVQELCLLITAIVCGLRSIWIVAKPILKKIWEMIKNYEKKHKGGSDDEKME